MNNSDKSNGWLWDFIKGILVAVIITLLLVFAFALIIKYCNIDNAYIPLINQVIKSVSIVVAMLMCFAARPNGWLRGLLFGIMYILLSFLMFSAFNCTFEPDIKLLNDCVLGGVTGLISGIIVVNVKKER